jgi:uncharacterized membrane protein
MGLSNSAMGRLIARCFTEGATHRLRPFPSVEDLMLELSRGTALVTATTAMGLMAGLFYAFACSVMLGLRRTDDRTFVGAMQQINIAIQNGWFFLIFAGALVFTAVAAALHLRGGGRGALPWIVAALVLYVAQLVITFGINIPLNDTLDKAGNPDHIADLSAVRVHFEAVWVRWNIVRAVVCTAGLGCLIWALVLHGRATT